MEKREQSELEKQLSDVCRRILCWQFRKKLRSKLNYEIIPQALHQYKYHSECLYKFLSSRIWECTYRVQDVDIGIGTGHTQSQSRKAALEEAYHKLVKSYCKVVLSDSGILCLKTSDTPFPDILNPLNAMAEFMTAEDCHEDNRDNIKKTRKYPPETDLSNFIIVKFIGANKEEIIPMYVLKYSAYFSGMLYNMDFYFDNGEFTCTVAIEGKKIAIATTDKKITVRNLAAEMTLEYLADKCWTLYINREVKDLGGVKMTKDMVLWEIRKLRPKETHPETGKEILKYIKRDGFTLQPNGENKKLEKAINQALNEHMFGDEIYLVFESKFSDLEKEKIRQIAQNHHVTVDDQVINNQVFVVIEKMTDDNYASCKRLNLGNSGKYFIKPPRTEKLSTSTLPQVQTSMVFPKQPAIPKCSTFFILDDHCDKESKIERDLSENCLKRPIPITDDINQICTKTMRPPESTNVSGGTFVPFNSNLISQNTLNQSIAACTTKPELLSFCSTKSEFSPNLAYPTKSQISPIAACPIKSEFPPCVYVPVPFQYLQFPIHQQATHCHQHGERIGNQCNHHQQNTQCTHHQHETQSSNKIEEATGHFNNQFGFLNQQEKTPYINFEERILHMNDQLETRYSNYQREAPINLDKPTATHLSDDQHEAPLYHSQGKVDQDQYSLPLYSYLKLMS